MSPTFDPHFSLFARLCLLGVTEDQEGDRPNFGIMFYS